MMIEFILNYFTVSINHFIEMEKVKKQEEGTSKLVWQKNPTSLDEEYNPKHQLPVLSQLRDC